MSILNTRVCAVAGGNTGYGDCFLTLQNIILNFLVPGNFELTAAQMASTATALAALQAAAVNDNPALRIYPLPEVVGITDNTEDVVLQTFGYGAPAPVRDGRGNIQFQYIKGGNCVNNQLRKFNNLNYKWIFVDAAGILVGTKVGTSLKGIPLDYFYASPFKINDGSNVTAFMYRTVFNPTYINEGLGFIPMNLADLQAIAGFQNAVVTLGAARATNVIKVKVLTGCAGTDLYDTYSAELANAARWAVTEGGNAITITSVAVDANIKGWTITLDAADPDYTVGGPFSVNLAAPSVLAAAGVPGFEGLALVVA